MGNPVDHSKSPWIHARFAELTGEPVEYGKRLIGLDEFPPAVRAFVAEGGKGCNITVPFKFQAAALVTRRSARAALAEACNILTFRDGEVLGDNTDGMASWRTSSTMPACRWRTRRAAAGRGRRQPAC
jgi:shikimate dehydrogenase